MKNSIVRFGYASLVLFLMVTVLFGVGVFAESNESISNQSVLWTRTGNDSGATPTIQETVTVVTPTSTPVNETTVPTTTETLNATPTSTPTAEPTPSPTLTQNVTPTQTSSAALNASVIVSNQTNGKSFSGGLFAAPVNPEFAEYLNRSKTKSAARTMVSVVLSNGSTTHVFVDGSIPSPVSFAHTAGQHIGPDNGISINRDTYTSTYDLRTSGKVSSVKDQLTAGSCWAFAAIDSLQSYFLSGESWDFSENNMKNTLASTYADGFDRTWDGGGNMHMAAAYLTRWSGPVKESDDPYSDSSGVSPGDLFPVKHVQNVYFLPKRASSTDNDNIKYALTTWGAVAVSIYWDSSYYNSSTQAFYNGGTSSTNHLITLVGWNDTYSRTNFATQPSGNGAFIAKNSWGTPWGDSGYFYISYYDLTVGNYATVFTGESVSNYNREYSYDPLGEVNNIGTGTTIASYANVFTSSSTETLKAVGFYTPTTNTAYVVSIYLNPNSGPINTGGYAARTSGTLSSPGYHTVTVPDVALSSGQKFSIVVSATTPGYNYPIPIEEPQDWYSSHATASAGQSYVSEDGLDWDDLTTVWGANANVCVKGYTNVVSKVGVFRPSTNQWFIDYNGNGYWDGGDRTYTFGMTGDTPVTGDWNGDGTTEIGVFRPSSTQWFIDYNGNGYWDGGDRTYTFGMTGDTPVTGDWNGGGTTEIGVFRPSTNQWFIDYNGNGYWDSGDRTYTFGMIGYDTPVTGNWNGGGTTEIGVFRPSSTEWFIDYNGNGYWDSGDRTYTFGMTGDTPVTGDWNGI